MINMIFECDLCGAKHMNEFLAPVQITKRLPTGWRWLPDIEELACRRCYEEQKNKKRGV